MEKQSQTVSSGPAQDLILESRSRLTVTGVRRVLRCDEDGAAIETVKGILHLAGSGLSVVSLDLDAGELRDGWMRLNIPNPAPRAACCAV